jgi:hypothetical protein
MAYVGILVRGDETFGAIYNDPPVARELALAGKHLGVGFFNGDSFYLNIEVLSRIGKVDASGNVQLAGFKTSEVQIDFDGVGYIKRGTDHVLIDNLYKFYYAASGLKRANLTNITLTDGTDDIDLDVDTLVFAQAKPVSITVGETETSVIFDTALGAAGFRVYNETTGTLLGFGTNSNDTVTYAAQPAGSIVSACLIDTDYNYSKKLKGTV